MQDVDAREVKTMFTLRSFPALALGVGVAIAGCASPVDEPADQTDEAAIDETSDALTTRVDSEHPTPEEPDENIVIGGYRGGGYRGGAYRGGAYRGGGYRGGGVYGGGGVYRGGGVYGGGAVYGAGGVYRAGRYFRGGAWVNCDGYGNCW